jgi:hypothetical protein
MSRTAYLARLERERLQSLERRAKARTEARAVEEGVCETVTLSSARGTAFEAPPRRRGEREKPYRRQPGLEWLSGKGRLTCAQRQAGERYGAIWRRVHGEPSIRSTLDVKPGFGASEGGPVATLVAQAEHSAHAAGKLDALRRRLSGQPSLIAACDAVCGRELTPREATDGEREAGKLEAVLLVALDILAVDQRSHVR